ncbi:MAG: single-stranded-DNA-specific exonuclease RecJ [Oscillospiraceae bacterium]
MKYQKWSFATIDRTVAQSLAQEGIPPLCAAVLSARGMETKEDVKDFLACDGGMLCDPFSLRDMDKAVARIEKALENGETIAVYGDYDVDGITSSCLLTHYLRSRGGNVILYIPDRLEEGYGLNREAVSCLHGQGVTLIVTVDCGITAVAETEFAGELGIDVVITDHHECKEVLPAAVAVVDPHRPDCSYPCKDLAGVGVSLKLVLALGGDGLLETYCDLAAIGTVADVMTLTGENRAIVTLGLERIAAAPRPGITALLCQAGAGDKPVTAVTIGYTLAPRLNAAGRMGCAQVAARLLLTEDPGEGETLAAELCALNRQRQEIEGGIYEDCVARLEREGRHPAALVMDGNDWHQGVVGIVASRLAERYATPALMLCVQDGVGKGSCRSYGGFNLYEALSACSDLLLGFGGHALAAGLTIAEENIPAFRARMEEYVREKTGGEPMESVLAVDGELPDASLLIPREIDGLTLLEPHGTGNPRPVFALTGCTVAFLSEVGGGRHLKLKIRCGETVLDGIFFSATAADAGIATGDKIDVAFHPQMNEFRGKRNVQLQILDLRPAPTRAHKERALYEKFACGQEVTAQEAAQLLPTREEFGDLWRYVKSRCAQGPWEESATHLPKNLMEATGRRQTYSRAMVCIEVLAERGLIAAKKEGDRLQLSLTEFAGKADLEASGVMIKLRKQAETI